MATIQNIKQARRNKYTPKQQAFINHYCSAECNMNATQAARLAGYQGSDNTLRVVASENLAKPNIRKEIDLRMKEALSSTSITVEKILCDLEMTRINALAERRYSAALRCSELQGKYLGMFNGKGKIGNDKTIDKLSTEELVKLLHSVAKSGGIDLIQLLKDCEDE